MENVSWHENKRGCHLDAAEENDVLIYLVSFLGSLAVLPGNIVSALFMEKVGRVKIIGDRLTRGPIRFIGCCFLMQICVIGLTGAQEAFSHNGGLMVREEAP